MRHTHINCLRSTLVFVVLVASLGVTTAPLGAQEPGVVAPSTSGSAVLVGLKPGASLNMGALGVSASDNALSASISALRVQSAGAVFRAVTGSGRVNVAGIASPIDLRAVYRLRLSAGADVAAAVRALNGNSSVVYAEPDGIAHLITTPNDPLFAQQWGWRRSARRRPGPWSPAAAA